MLSTSSGSPPPAWSSDLEVPETTMEVRSRSDNIGLAIGPLQPVVVSNERPTLERNRSLPSLFQESELTPGNDDGDLSRSRRGSKTSRRRSANTVDHAAADEIAVIEGLCGGGGSFAMLEAINHPATVDSRPIRRLSRLNPLRKQNSAHSLRSNESFMVTSHVSSATSFEDSMSSSVSSFALHQVLPSSGTAAGSHDSQKNNQMTQSQRSAPSPVKVGIYRPVLRSQLSWSSRRSWSGTAADVSAMDIEGAIQRWAEVDCDDPKNMKNACDKFEDDTDTKDKTDPSGRHEKCSHHPTRSRNDVPGKLRFDGSVIDGEKQTCAQGKEQQTSHQQQRWSWTRGKSSHHGESDGANHVRDSSCKSQYVSSRGAAFAQIPIQGGAVDQSRAQLKDDLRTLGESHRATRSRLGSGTRVVRASAPGAVQMRGRAPLSDLPAWSSSRGRRGHQGPHPPDCLGVAAVATVVPRVARTSSQASSDCNLAFAIPDIESTNDIEESDHNPLSEQQREPANDSENDMISVEAEFMPSIQKIILRDRACRRLLVAGSVMFSALIVAVLFVALRSVPDGSRPATDSLEDSDQPSSQDYESPGGKGEGGHNHKGTAFLPSSSDYPTVAPTISMAPTIDIRSLRSALSAFSSLYDLNNPVSPQYHALQWLGRDKTGANELNENALAQRYACAVLYFATSNGEGWLRKENWMQSSLNECDWGASIVCEGFSDTRHVKKIDLSQNRLMGSLPSELRLLTNLETLYLDVNGLYGSVPSELGELGSLTDLDLEDNKLSGTVPSSFGELSSLRTFSLSKNKISGTFPDPFYKLPLLRGLYLAHNDLTGTLCNSIVNLTSLTSLNIRDNKFTGTLTESVNKLFELAHLYLDHNMFTGTLPPMSGLIRRRETLTVSHNLFTGSLPSPPGLDELLSSGVQIPIGELRLQKIDMSHNMLSGTFPATVSLVPPLTHFDVSHNRFAGTISPRIAMLTNLERWSMGGNDLTGPIPNLQSMKKLRYVDLHGNKLTNGVPEFLGALPLRELDLSGNLLGGTLPPALGNLSATLRRFNAFNCSLNGTIPTEMAGLKEMSHLDLRHNDLEGSLPAELCEAVSLDQVYLSSNSLSGTLPQCIEVLGKLTVLSIEDNQLSGTIPETLSQLQALKELRLHDNNLFGTVPLSVCQLKDDELEYFTVDTEEVICDCCDSL